MKSSSAASNLKKELVEVDGNKLQEGGLNNLELTLGISSDNGMSGAGASNPWLGVGVHPWSLAARQEKAALEQAHQASDKCAVQRDSRPAGVAAAATAPPQLVGWPPVRAFRKKLSSAPNPKPANEAKVNAAGCGCSCGEDEDGDELVGTRAAGEEQRRGAQGSLFVKVNLQGYAVGRKIDLKAHRGYDALSQALQAMFHASLSDGTGTGAGTGGIESREDEEELERKDKQYILLYEDNEGDRMLVGDVPWELFITSVKRLYIALA